MGFRLFDWQYIFFEEFDHRKDAGDGSSQAEQQNSEPALSKKLCQHEVL